MLNRFRLLATALAFVSVCASAQDTGPAHQEFTPKSGGNGRVVVIISGQSGMPAYTMTAQQIADADFDVGYGRHVQELLPDRYGATNR